MFGIFEFQHINYFKQHANFLTYQIKRFICGLNTQWTRSNTTPTIFDLEMLTCVTQFHPNNETEID